MKITLSNGTVVPVEMHKIRIVQKINLVPAQERRAACYYFQTEGPRGRGQQSYLYRYAWTDTGTLAQRERTPVPALINLDDYLRAHLDNYEEKGFSKDSGGRLERAVAAALDGQVDQMLSGVKPMGVKDQVEMDLVVRCGNRVGVLEVKSGGEGSGKKAVDQLTTAVAREYMGTYTARFIVTPPEKHDEFKALAAALKVRGIELRDYAGGAALSAKDTTTLREIVAQELPKT